LGAGRNRLGGSILLQVHNQVGDDVPDLDDPALVRGLFDAVQRLNREGLLLAYHDRSDGGLFVSLCEMAFAAKCGLSIDLDGTGADGLSALFAEELGAVLQVPADQVESVMGILGEHGLSFRRHVHVIGRPTREQQLEFRMFGNQLYSSTLSQLRGWYSETTLRMQELRDNPQCAAQEYELSCDAEDPGLRPDVRFEIQPALEFATVQQRPKVAILREQGVNGQLEMAAAFERAGFSAVDVHMTDILSGKQD